METHNCLVKPSHHRRALTELMGLVPAQKARKVRAGLLGPRTIKRTSSGLQLPVGRAAGVGASACGTRAHRGLNRASGHGVTKTFV